MIITIERLGHLGDGIANVAGEGIFAARTLPGEVIEGEVTESRMAAPRIVTPSADRVSAPCRHYKSCGGCALQHASDPFVAAWKVDVVRRALTAQGLDAPFRAIHTSPPYSRRRATLAGRRLKSGALVGFHGRASGTMTAVPDCHLLDPALTAAFPLLEDLTARFASRKGEIALTVTHAAAGLDIAVTGGKPLDDALRAELGAWAGANPVARLAWDAEIVAQAAPPTQPFGRAHVAPPPGAFLQATPQGEGALLAAVRDAVGDSRRVVDLFAGSGTFTLPLAETAEVLAVEGEAPMLAALDTGWRQAPHLRRVTTQARDLFRRPLLPPEFKGYDAVVIDPPRAGAEAQVSELAQSDMPVIAALSCNPVTFARDAKILIDGGYVLNWVQVVDQFRWSPHVELAARFTKPHMPRN
ncbi:class I SAM-dependent RNA methyltransferase [Roseicitreum antarcticum]|uniref:23S rRNA m(5)U-1939 methyltransferase n=1 Tax=Roseicitreum antarcticum TaxID=564137 RepID=A0A1H2X295_9RHOB|nr:class I SAM-dependent RNA methyltransferase [Roseicitreum antarcticum]SDW87000.1 23S rRNA m(5)U-1939 methyltransferase [Roseicitreum antarcticum]